MITFFENENFIQLDYFFNENKIKNIKKKILNEKFDLKYSPLEYKYKEFEIKNTYNLEILKLTEYFKSKNFLEYLEEIIQIELRFIKVKIKKYKKGDFILLNDNQKREDLIEVFFDLTLNWEENFGGEVVYVLKKEEVFSFRPKNNSLTVIYKSDQVLKYLKYINSLSKNKEILRFEIKFEIEE